MTFLPNPNRPMRTPPVYICLKHTVSSGLISPNNPPWIAFEARKSQNRPKVSSVQVNFLPGIFGKNKSANASRLSFCGKLVRISINGINFPPVPFELLVENYRKYGIDADIELLTSTPDNPLSFLLTPDENELLSDYRELSDTGKEAARNMVKGLKTTFPKQSASNL